MLKSDAFGLGTIRHLVPFRVDAGIKGAAATSGQAVRRVR